MSRNLSFELLVPLDTSLYNLCSDRKKDLIKADYVPSKTEEKVAMVSHKNIIVSDNCYCKTLVCKLKRYALYMPYKKVGANFRAM
jgi:hypothetical protein